MTEGPPERPPERPTRRPFLTVVVPVYRTAWALPELVRRIAAVAAERGWRTEIVLVDDASPDDARQVAGRLATESDPVHLPVRLLALAENRGQHRAVLAGLAASRGEWVVVMDGDLQDPPEAIPALVDRADEGFEAVFAARVNRYQSPGRMLTSRLFKGALSRTCGLPAGSGMFFVASRRLVDRLRTDDPRPFVVAMVGLAGLPVSSVPVERAERAQGASAYSPWRRLSAGLGALAFVHRHRTARAALHGPGGGPPGTPLPGLVGLGAALLTFLVGLLGLRAPFDVSDEGFRVLLSQGWADGVPLFEAYRLHYVPGQYVVFGSALDLFGPSIAVLRSAEAAVTAVGVGALAWAIARVTPPALALSGAAALAGVAARNHATLASALVLAAALTLAHLWHRQPGPKAASGWVPGFAALAGFLVAWREDAAVYALALTVLAALVLRPAARRPLRSTVILWLGIFGGLLGGLLGGFLPWILAFGPRHQLTDLVRHLGHRLVFLFERLAAPVRGGWSPPDAPLASVRDLAGALFPLLAAAPLLVYAAILLHQWRRRRAGAPIWAPAVAAALTGAAYLPQFLWERPDLAHFRAHLHLLVAVLVVALAGVDGRRARPALRRAAPIALVLLALAGAAYSARTLGTATELYPSEAGRRIGARWAGEPPPWAGRLGPETGGMIVLGWGPGWYVLEGQTPVLAEATSGPLERRGGPATRFLYTGPRGLRDGAAASELRADLEDPAVRWVLVGPQPTPDAPEVTERARELYGPVEPGSGRGLRWGWWELLEREP